MKKLNVGECSWYTCQNLFGCIVDTITMAISLLAHRYQQLRNILDSTPFHQNGISIKNGTRYWESSSPWSWLYLALEAYSVK